MATYKKRAGSDLTASLNINYGGKSMVKSLSRSYQEVTEIKKVVDATDTGVEVCAFNTGTQFLAGTQKMLNYCLFAMREMLQQNLL